jgi:hypothetical protein
MRRARSSEAASAATATMLRAAASRGSLFARRQATSKPGSSLLAISIDAPSPRSFGEPDTLPRGIIYTREISLDLYIRGISLDPTPKI